MVWATGGREEAWLLPCSILLSSVVCICKGWGIFSPSQLIKDSFGLIGMLKKMQLPVE